MNTTVHGHMCSIFSCAFSTSPPSSSSPPSPSPPLYTYKIISSREVFFCVVRHLEGLIVVDQGVPIVTEVELCISAPWEYQVV